MMEAALANTTTLQIFKILFYKVPSPH